METHEELRPYLFSIAYRMLGSVAEAEDVVQEAFLRYHETDVEADSPKAYLATVTTRLAIDELRSARARREVYPGDWLPEPLVDDEAVRHAETADSLSLAFLHLLERLSPTERAVFLLREVFDYPYDDVARIVGKSPRTAVRSSPARTSTSRRGAAASTSHARSETRSHRGSSPPGRRATPRGSSGCSPPTRPSTATAAARRPRFPSRSSEPSAWRRR